jgi:hypothetical protein
MWSKIFRRNNKSQESTKRARWRLQSCIETILDLSDRLGEGMIRPEIIEHFRKLKNSFYFLEDEMVDEKEISSIEEATNQLLEEVGKLYDETTMKQLYDIPKH